LGNEAGTETTIYDRAYLKQTSSVVVVKGSIEWWRAYLKANVNLSRQQKAKNPLTSLLTQAEPVSEDGKDLLIKS